MTKQMLLGLLLVLLLPACEQRQPAPPFTATDISAADFGRDFRLTDHHGRARQLSDFRGKVVLLFFGYTYCPDICPTTMSTMVKVIKRLGKDAGKVQVLFVTLDPARDTRAVLARYVPFFHPGFLGLYGDTGATAKVAADFRVYAKRQQGASANGYTLDHSAGSYVFDQNGKLRLYLDYGQSVDAIAQDLRLLLKEAAPKRFFGIWRI